MGRHSKAEVKRLETNPEPSGGLKHDIQMNIKQGELDLVDSRGETFGLTTRPLIVGLALKRLVSETDFIRTFGGFTLTYESKDAEPIYRYHSNQVVTGFTGLPTLDPELNTLKRLQIDLGNRERQHMQDIQEVLNLNNKTAVVVKSLSRFMSDLEILKEYPDMIVRYVSPNGVVMAKYPLKLSLV